MLYLIDSSIYIFRAYYSMPDTLVDVDGRPCNAVYGFTRFLCDLLEQASYRAREAAPDAASAAADQKPYLAAAFDESLTTSFRNDIYPAYKANRELPPPELEYQLSACRRIASMLGIHTLADSCYEADDLIGSLAHQHRQAADGVTIVSRDKDLAQLLADDDWFWDFASQKRFQGAEVELHYGVRADQIIDLLALAGDAVDNIPGVAGVGRKTAMQLLKEFNSMENLYAQLDDVRNLSIRGAQRLWRLLHEQREQAEMSRRLTEISLDAPVVNDIGALAWNGYDWNEALELCEQFQFGSGLTARIRRLSTG